MKKLSAIINSALVFSILAFTINLTSCKKEENPIKFQKGTFPDSTIALTDLNSVYNDYNSTIYQLLNNIVIVFSSDRISTGEQFDLVQGVITYVFNQTDGTFGLGAEITQDAFLTKLLNAANTSKNDFGPYRLFSSEDGFEYLILSSENTNGDLDYYFLKNQPVYGTVLPAVSGPYSASLLNTSSDDSYFCFDLNQDTAYFSSDRDGNFDIYLKNRPADTDITAWLSGTFSTASKVEGINTTSDDKCPYIYKKIMVFASDRPGGFGNFDLYYSVFQNGNWSSPHNMGSDINTPYNEFRPVIGTDRDFTNNFIIFSSDRPEGKGDYDLYFRGISLP